ncbi:alpha/beta hydrolase [Viridibacillus sp. YIM B01967]|uniref:Alpha/beta hydrolase n=2 Tax=Viridibacillus soli TaxID=2798301 RepID=A0ABS1H4H2_9BACL|nr:alpha/beta hydrolase [Viridibacillus soli]
MNKVAHTIKASDGHLIAVTVYRPIGQPKGHIHILHGMAEHSARYDVFAIFLTEHDYIVSTHDHRGHGQTATLNEAPRGYYADEQGFDRAVLDVHEVLAFVRVDLHLPPTVLFGHSMGSFIARRYTELHSETLSKAIFCGTGAASVTHRAGHILAKCLAKKHGKTKESPLLDKLSFGNFNRAFPNTQTDFDWLSSDIAEVKKYIADDNCGFLATNQFYADLTGGILKLSKREEMNRIRKDLPILLISGADDPVGGFSKGIWKVAKSYQSCGLTNITVQLFVEKRHEILNEVNREEVYNSIIRWLEKE